MTILHVLKHFCQVYKNGQLIITSHTLRFPTFCSFSKNTNFNFPIDALTVLKTSKNVSSNILPNVGNGFYWRYGVENF